MTTKITKVYDLPFSKLLESHFEGITFSYNCLRDDEEKKRKTKPNKKNYEKAQYYLLNPEVTKEIARLREKYGLGQDGIWTLEELTDWYKNYFGKNEKLYQTYCEEIELLPGIVNETSNWDKFFENYLLFNEINGYTVPPSVVVDAKRDKTTKKLEVTITAKDYASKEDYIDAVDFATKLMAEPDSFGKKKIREGHNFDRNAKIYRQYLEGLKNSQITEDFNSKCKPGEEIDEAYVAKIIKRVKAKTKR